MFKRLNITPKPVFARLAAAALSVLFLFTAACDRPPLPAYDSGAYITIPGFAPIVAKGSKITHSIVRPVTFVYKNQVWEIKAAYLEGRTINIDLFLYSKGQDDVSRRAESPENLTVQYKGKTADKRNFAYATLCGLSFWNLSLPKNETCVISLLEGDKKVTDLTLEPVRGDAGFTSTRPYAVSEDHGVTLAAQVYRQEDKLEVYLNSLIIGQEYEPVSRTFGGFYEADEVYLEDTDGVRYETCAKTADILNAYYGIKEVYHYYIFDVPAGQTGLRLIVPEIQYTQTSGSDFKMKAGPFAIDLPD